MTKAFLEAFPGVDPEDEEMADLLRHTTVTRMVCDKERTTLKIYLTADRLIPKKIPMPGKGWRPMRESLMPSWRRISRPPSG